MLRPTAEGVLEPLDITGQDAIFLNQKDISGNARAVEIKPTRIYQVRGMRGIKRLCIHMFDTTQLLDLYSAVQNPVLSEKMLADLLDISYQKGLKEGSGASGVNEGLAKYLKIIMICSAAAAVLSILIYLSLK